MDCASHIWDCAALKTLYKTHVVVFATCKLVKQCFSVIPHCTTRLTEDNNIKLAHVLHNVPQGNFKFAVFKPLLGIPRQDYEIQTAGAFVGFCHLRVGREMVRRRICFYRAPSGEAACKRLNNGVSLRGGFLENFFGTAYGQFYKKLYEAVEAHVPFLRAHKILNR